MRWNGEDQANGAAAAGPPALPLGTAGPFDRAAWFDLLAALHWLGQRRCDAQGSAAGCAAQLPLVEVTPGHATSLANWYSFVHRPLFSGSTEPAARGAALQALFRTLGSRLHRLTLYPLSETDGSHLLVQAALRDAGWHVNAAPVGHCHWLDLAGHTHDSWWAERPGALRNTVARKAKKGLVELRIADRFDADLWAAYERIYASSWKPAEGNAALLRAFAEAEGRAGRIRLGLATIAGEPVAAQFWTVENGCAYIHKLAHVEDSVRASPGTLLTAALFRRVIEQDGVHRVDFGTGNDPYKRDWMNRHNRLWRIDAFNLRRPRAWLPMIGALASQWRKTNEGN